MVRGDHDEKHTETCVWDGHVQANEKLYSSWIQGDGTRCRQSTVLEIYVYIGLAKLGMRDQPKPSFTSTLLVKPWTVHRGMARPVKPVLGWMQHTVLGAFDLLLVSPPSDIMHDSGSCLRPRSHRS